MTKDRDAYHAALLLEAAKLRCRTSVSNTPTLGNDEVVSIEHVIEDAGGCSATAPSEVLRQRTLHSAKLLSYPSPSSLPPVPRILNMNTDRGRVHPKPRLAHGSFLEMQEALGCSSIINPRVTATKVNIMASVV